MKREVLMLAVAMLAGLVGGAVSHQLFQEKVLRAERFELVSQDGKTRAVLGERTVDDPPPKGRQPFPGLFWVDEDGKTRAVFGVEADRPSLALYGSKGGISVLSMEDDGPYFDLSGSTGEGGALLRVRGNVPDFTLSAPTGESVLSVGYIGPFLGLESKEGGGGSSLSVGPSGPYFSLYGLKGKGGESVVSVGDDGPRLSLADKDSKTRAILRSTRLKDPRTGSVAPRPPSSLVLFGEQGDVLWQAP